MYILLYQRVSTFSSTLAVISICFSLHEDFILQSQTLHMGICSGARISIFCHVVIKCLLSSESVNKVNPRKFGPRENFPLYGIVNYHMLAGLESGTLLTGNVSKFNLSLSVCNLTQS